MKLQKVKTDFTQVSNAILNDGSLSWKAKGLYAYLYSKPDGWEFSAERIMRESSDGRDSTRSALRELEEAGYLYRAKKPTGKMEYVLDIQPMTENPSLGQEPMTEKPNDGKTHSGKTRRISNTEIYSNTETKSNTDVAQLLIGQFAEKIGQLPQQQLAERDAFLGYWTERNARGKTRYEGEKYFDIRRRWATWMSHKKEWGRKFEKQPESAQPQGYVMPKGMIEEMERSLRAPDPKAQENLRKVRDMKSGLFLAYKQS